MRPIGITVIAALFALAAGYLCAVAATLLIWPGSLSLMVGKSLMYGQQLAGPYMMLLFGGAYAIVGWGLFRLQKWARWIALAVMVISVASLVPEISTAELGAPVFWYGLQMAVRVAVGWYLAQAPAVIDAFSAKR